MSVKDYFCNLQNRYSANFIAMSSCISFVYAIVYVDYHLYNFRQQFSYTDIFLSDVIISAAIIGFTVLFAIFPLSIPFYLLLKNKENHRNWIYITSFILLCIILCIIFGYRTGLASNINSVLFFIIIYFPIYKLLLPIFITIPILCVIDCKNNILVTNCSVVNNRPYRLLIYIFFFYFWLQYIPFMLVLVFYVCADLYALITSYLPCLAPHLLI